MSPLLFAAVILAAGRSSRMGQFKPLMKINGQTLIHHAISVFQHNLITDIIVVAGHRAVELAASIANEDVLIAHNESYTDGMFSSVMTGIAHLPKYCSAFFILPADIAFVQPATISQLITVFHENPDCICYPNFKKRRGHPPLIPAFLADSIAIHKGDAGLRQILKRWQNSALDVHVMDQHILFDIDSPDDLVNLEALLRKSFR